MWADTAIPLLENLPNGGAVVAVLAVVWVFLRKQERSEDAVRAALAAYAADAASARREYREHVTEIMRMGLAAHEETRAAIRALDATLGVLKEAGDPDPKGAPR
jgi:uncharacterized membrane protein YccC